MQQTKPHRCGPDKLRCTLIIKSVILAIVRVPDLIRVHDSTKAEAKLPADDLRVQRELLRG